MAARLFEVLRDRGAALHESFSYVYGRRLLDRLGCIEKDLNCGCTKECLRRFNALVGNIKISADDECKLACEAMVIEVSVLSQLVERIPFSAGFDDPEIAPAPAEKSSAPPVMSALINAYVDETAAASDWSKKDQIRWRAMLKYFVEIVGDKSLKTYKSSDGAEYRAIQLTLPAHRNLGQMRGKSARACVAIADKMQLEGLTVRRLSPSVKDKIGCVGRFFQWARTRYPDVENLMVDIKVSRPKETV